MTMIFFPLKDQNSNFQPKKKAFLKKSFVLFEIYHNTPLALKIIAVLVENIC